MTRTLRWLFRLSNKLVSLSYKAIKLVNNKISTNQFYVYPYEHDLYDEEAFTDQSYARIVIINNIFLGLSYAHTN